jgi:hypothetical protein
MSNTRTARAKPEPADTDTPAAAGPQTISPSQAVSVLDQATQGPLVGANGQPCNRQDYLLIAQALQVLYALHPPDG